MSAHETIERSSVRSLRIVELLFSGEHIVDWRMDRSIIIAEKDEGSSTLRYHLCYSHQLPACDILCSFVPGQGNQPYRRITEGSIDPPPLTL